MADHPLPSFGLRHVVRRGGQCLPALLADALQASLLVASLGLWGCSPHQAHLADQHVQAVVAQGTAEVEAGARKARLTSERGALPTEVLPASSVLAGPSATASSTAALQPDAVAVRATQALRKTADLVANEAQDAGITARLRAEIDNDGTLQGLHIQVDTRDGNVLLQGQVPSLAARTHAAALARDVQGVKHVDNQLELRG